MKKLIAMLAATLFAAPLALGQETVTGTVVDKKGKPLPGVKVEIPGSKDFTISDLDGTFRITPLSSKDKKVTASYAGMNSRKKKLKDGMTIKMTESSWRSRPEEWKTFANFILAVPNVDDTFRPAYGLMLGRVKTWGYYIKGVTNTFGHDTDGSFSDYSRPNGFIDKEQPAYWSVTAGGMVRLGCPLHLYVGVGYASYKYYVRNMSDEWYEYHGDDCMDNFAVDAGLMYRLKNFTITVGTTAVPYNRWCSHHEKEHFEVKAAGNIGIGYTF